jgi:hypothetical protein
VIVVSNDEMRSQFAFLMEKGENIATPEKEIICDE